MPLDQHGAIAQEAAADFAAVMAGFGPFEARPHLAVAVSGGGDSMALLLLAHDWARARGGRVSALTVDHGLRPGSAAEAAQVAGWCRSRGIAPVILTREGPAPAHGIQAFAREARYRLLEEWCRRHGVLHLLLAHQREDQAETAALREASGSGADGRAGMAAIVERCAVRLLRPLLGTPRARLRSYLLARDQAWIEDPSNRNPAFTRVRIRAALAQAGAAGPAAIAAQRDLGAARAAREAAAARSLARFVAIDPAGFAVIAPGAFAAGALDPQALGAVLATVSGNMYPPRTARIERLHRALAEGLTGAQTLGGCLVAPWRGKILVCREPGAVAAPLPVAPGAALRWDGRFRVMLGAGAPAGLSIGALGADAPAIARKAPKGAATRLPATVRAALPALRDVKGVVAVPALGYFKSCRKEAETAACRVEFMPIRSLTGAGFTIV